MILLPTILATLLPPFAAAFTTRVGLPSTFSSTASCSRRFLVPPPQPSTTHHHGNAFVFFFFQSTAPSSFCKFSSSSSPRWQLHANNNDEASSSSSSSSPAQLTRIPPDMEGVAIPFVDVAGNSFIECYADSVATVGGVEYTIGVPCDYSVALCYFDESEQLVPVELDDQELMDDIFPMAEAIVAEEFGEELSLQRTPQTLTLVGELEEDDDDDDMNDDEDGDDEMGMDSDDDDDDEEEEVEVLLSFEHRGKDFNLVRLLDPILLVGKVDPSAPDNRLLLTPTESDQIMPLLEKAFLDFHDDDDNFDDDDDLLP